MNIQFQICGLCILILLIIFYKSHKNLNLYKEKVFFTVMRIMTVSIVFDILSLVAIKYSYLIPPLLVEFICKTYVITLVWVVWSAEMYIMADINDVKMHRRITFWSALFAAAQSLIIYLLPIYVFDDGNQMYTYGPAILCVYAFVAIYIILILSLTFVYRKMLNPRRKFAISIWMLIWLISAVIQFINNGLLLVGFAGVLGVLILFVVMENPEGKIDRQLECFNSYALSEYLDEMYEDGRAFSLLGVTIVTEDISEEQDADVNAKLKRILNMCGEVMLTFKNVNSGLILIDSEEALQRVQKSVEEDFQKDKSHQDRIFITPVPDGSAFSGTEELFRFLAFAESKSREKNEYLIISDERMVSDYKSCFFVDEEIKRALAEDRVEVFLQPIYSTKEKSFTSAEALMRIRNEDGSMMSPAIFIPVAEKNGQIIELGERIFEKVCDAINSTDIVKNGIHYVEINLSVVQCERKDLSQRLIGIVEKYGIDPGLINLEITETASISARKTLHDNMKRLIDYGFTFSLDDFGEGQSNLMYVVEMPVSFIKLDYDMSKAYFNIPKAKQVVKAVCSMSQNMGLAIVAEGIETKEEAEQIMSEGIDYIQGYYYSRPLPLPEFINFIAEKNKVS